MEHPTLTMCRICLAVDVRMHTIIYGHLQRVYEHLSMRPLETQDERPTQACYICFARLKNCYQLWQSCVRSEDLLTEMLSSGMMNQATPLKIPRAKNLEIVHPVMRLSVEDTLEQNTDCNVLREACDIYFEVKIEPADTEDIDSLTEDFVTPTHDVPSDATCRVPLVRVKMEPLEVEANIKKEVSEETVLDDYTQSSDLEDDISLETVKKKLDYDNTDRRPPEETRCETRHKSGTSASSKNQHSVTNRMMPAPSTSNIYYSDNSSVNVDHKSSSGTSPNDVNECNTSQKHLHVKTKKKVFRTSAGERPFQCDVCKKCFKRKDNLEGHMRTHADTKPYQCNVCDKSFIRKYSLENHIRLHTGEKPYQCDICKKCYRVKGSLDSHVATHTTERPFKCDLCPKTFSQKYVLDNHLRIHSGIRPHECSFCKKRFSHKGNLNSHIRVHTGEKPNQCNTCKKCYKLKSNLDNHICSHTCERPFQCNVCEKTFAVEINLENHMRIHTGEKPY